MLEWITIENNYIQWISTSVPSTPLIIHKALLPNYTAIYKEKHKCFGSDGVT